MGTLKQIIHYLIITSKDVRNMRSLMMAYIAILHGDVLYNVINNACTVSKNANSFTYWLGESLSANTSQ